MKRSQFNTDVGDSDFRIQTGQLISALLFGGREFQGPDLRQNFLPQNLLKILWFYGAFSFHNKINRGRQSFGVQLKKKQVY